MKMKILKIKKNLKFQIILFNLKVLLRCEQDGDVFEKYWNIELKCRRVTRIMVNLVFVHQLPYIAVFYTICRIYVGNFDTSSWPHLFNFAVPFDAKSVFGWYLLWFIQFIVDFLHVFCMVFNSSYFVCCCYYVEGICEHFDFVM